MLSSYLPKYHKTLVFSFPVTFHIQCTLKQKLDRKNGHFIQNDVAILSRVGMQTVGDVIWNFFLNTELTEEWKVNAPAKHIDSHVCE